jgi:hypothetical protein
MPNLLPNHKRFLPAQRLLAAKRACPECEAAAGKPCIYIWRQDRLKQPMPGFHVERYPLEAP